MSLQTRILTLLAQWLAKFQESDTPRLNLLAGDGSTRQFFRLQLGSQSWVLLFDEGFQYSKDYAPLQSYLKSLKLPVPEFDYIDAKSGIIVMQDLGDQYLQQDLDNEPLQKLKEATKLLAQLHGKSFPVPDNLPVATRRFDTQKYREELEFTQTHLIQGYWKLEKKDSKPLQTFCQQIEKVQPLVFCHRDYHTRNILVHHKELYLIDFQDARLGPPHYDLASLLYDAYVPLTEETRHALIETYQHELQKFPELSNQVNWKEWDKELSLIGFQRVVKAAGSFASFYTRYQKETHLPYIKPALETARLLQKRFPKELNPVWETLQLENLSC